MFTTTYLLFLSPTPISYLPQLFFKTLQQSNIYNLSIFDLKVQLHCQFIFSLL